MEKSFRSNTQIFEGKFKEVGVVLIGNYSLPIYEISVKVIAGKNIVDDEWDGFNKPEYEAEFINFAQKLLTHIEKEQPFALAFIICAIKRWYFEKSLVKSDGNPVRGFVQTWSNDFDGVWQTWIELPAVAEKRREDEVFQTGFKKWALLKFLQSVFGNQFLPTSFPLYGSEVDRFRNGMLDVDKLHAHDYSSKLGVESNLNYFYEDCIDKESDILFNEIGKLRE